jgi:hypothetical protein
LDDLELAFTGEEFVNLDVILFLLFLVLIVLVLVLFLFFLFILGLGNVVNACAHDIASHLFFAKCKY